MPLMRHACLLQSQVIFAAVDYFESVSPSGNIVFELNVWFNGMLFLFSVANALWLSRLGFTLRIVWGFIVMGVCMASVV